MQNKYRAKEWDVHILKGGEGGGKFLYNAPQSLQQNVHKHLNSKSGKSKYRTWIKITKSKFWKKK